MKKTAIILALCLCLACFSGCSRSAAAREHTLECGAALTARYALEEKPLAPFTTTLQSHDTAVLFLREYKQDLAPEMTLAQYGAMALKRSDLALLFAPDAYDTLAVTYTQQAADAEYYFYATVHETADSFWLVQMVCEADRQATFEPLFAQWLSTLDLSGTVSADAPA